MDLVERPRCNGGNRLDVDGRFVGRLADWCGEPATLVCSERDVERPLQWFTCDAHAGDARTEPIEQWFARLELPQ